MPGERGVMPKDKEPTHCSARSPPIPRLSIRQAPYSKPHVVLFSLHACPMITVVEGSTAWGNCKGLTCCVALATSLPLWISAAASVKSEDFASWLSKVVLSKCDGL